MPEQIVERRQIPLPPLPPGSESSLGVVDLVYDDGSVKRLWTKDDGVQVLGLTPEGKVIAIRERGYTHLVGGFVEPGENPETAARRELLEETGYIAESIELLAAPYQDSGGSERIIWLCLATGCRKAQDSETGIGVTPMSPSELWQHITNCIANPSEKRRGIMSLAVATLAFQKLGWLTVASR